MVVFDGLLIDDWVPGVVAGRTNPPQARLVPAAKNRSQFTYNQMIEFDLS
jgi:hypothetical protein